MTTTTVSRALVAGALALALGACGKSSSDGSVQKEPRPAAQAEPSPVAQEEPNQVAIPPDIDSQDELAAPPPPDEGANDDEPTDPSAADPVEVVEDDVAD